MIIPKIKVEISDIEYNTLSIAELLLSSYKIIMIKSDRHMGMTLMMYVGFNKSH